MGAVKSFFEKPGNNIKPQSFAVFDVEPFGHELPSGLSLRVEDKAEGLRRNEGFSVFSKRISFNGNKRGIVSCFIAE
jgi:hypothetical protein